MKKKYILLFIRQSLILQKDIPIFKVAFWFDDTSRVQSKTITIKYNQYK